MTKGDLKKLIKEIMNEITVFEGAPISDEFSDLPISQQRKWQLRMRKQGRCVTCGRPAVFSSFWCEKHYEDHKNREKERIRKIRHPVTDYQIEGVAYKDEFKDLPISRQRKYQMRMKQQGRCIMCGQPASEKSNLFCPKHHEIINLRNKELGRRVYAKQKAQKIGYEIED